MKIQNIFRLLLQSNTRANLITQLTLADGTTISNHELKANALFRSLNGRLGQSECTIMLYDLSHIIQQIQLPLMHQDFTVEEINQAISEIPGDHGSGPDDFNGTFMKKCWPLIKGDFLRVCLDFTSGNIDLTSINGSFIVLIQKKR